MTDPFTARVKHLHYELEIARARFNLGLPSVSLSQALRVTRAEIAMLKKALRECVKAHVLPEYPRDLLNELEALMAECQKAVNHVDE